MPPRWEFFYKDKRSWKTFDESANDELNAAIEATAPGFEDPPIEVVVDAQLAREFAANGQFCDDTDIPFEHDGRFAIWAKKRMAALKQEAANPPAVKPDKMNSRNRAKAVKAALEANNHTKSSS